MKAAINKNLKMILIIAAVTVIALGALLLLISGNEERSQVPTEETTLQTQEEETSKAIEVPKETTVATEPGVSQLAQTLYDSKVESIDAPPADIARLLETMDLKNNVADYTVQIQHKEDPKSLIITLDTTVSETEKTAFDNNMNNYAEQALALIGDLQQVQWTYQLKSEGKKAKETTVELNLEDAEKLLQSDVKAYGESAQSVQTLLEQQKGTRNGNISRN